MLGFDETITVYNSVHDLETGYDKYSKTVISGCSWQTTHRTGHTGSAFHRENLHKIRIPIEAVSDKTYVPELEFVDSATQYTLSSGDKIVRGIGNDISRPDELVGKYSDICTITAVHDNRRIGLPHIYVEGK